MLNKKKIVILSFILLIAIFLFVHIRLSLSAKDKELAEENWPEVIVKEGYRNIAENSLAEYDVQNTILKFNNQKINLTNNTIHEEDNIYVGLRKTIEALDLRIEWHQESGKIIISDFKENNMDLFIDGQNIFTKDNNFNIQESIKNIDSTIYINPYTLELIINCFKDYTIENYNDLIIASKSIPLKNGVFTIDMDGIFTKSPSGSFPLYSYNGLNNRLYFGYYNSENEIIIRFWDEELEQTSEAIALWRDWGKTSSGMLLGDDHANPSIIVLEHQENQNSGNNGKILVASAEHGGRLQTRRSSFVEDITMWKEPIEVFKKGATYARLVELSDGRIVLFSRISWTETNSKATYYYWDSEDSGDSWNGPFLLIDSDEGEEDAIYLEVVQNENSNELHFVFNVVKYNNPSKGIHRYVNIYYVKYDVCTNTWSRMNGQKAELPLQPSNIDLVYETNQNDWTYLSDIKIDKDNNPFILSCNDIDWMDNNSIFVQEHFYENGVWKTDVIASNDRFRYSDDLNFKGPWYANMASYDGNNIDTIYTSTRDQNSVGQLEIWKRKNRKWTKDKIITNDLYGNNARPFSVSSNDGSIRVLWNYITSYGASPYTEWRSMIRGLKSAPNQP